LELRVSAFVEGVISMASEHIKEITDQNFEQEVANAAEPVLVDFWAEWCMPCRMLAPTIEKLASDYAGKVKVGKVDTDANRDISMKFGISAIPTVLLFKNGQVVQKFVGLRQDKDFRAALDQTLAG
jgi:thioredoxin 1